MIILRDISLRRGPRQLFGQVDITLLPGQKIALTGANGCGKSSFFSMLRGGLGADTGEIEGLNNQRIAHMDQDVAATEQPALDFVIAGDDQIHSLLTQLKQAEDAQDYELAASRHQALEEVDGYAAQRRAEQLMLGLGFSRDDRHRPLSDFSGGWRVRLGLARALMAPSELLLLDEPTNHLDLDTTFWLRDFLRQYKGTLILISHDRDFIDSTCNVVLHIEQQTMRAYRGGYSEFERQRALHLAEQRAQAEKHLRRRAEIEDFVRRFRAKATKARQAQSRLKELERMGEVELAHQESPFSFSFPAPPRGRDPLIDMRGAAIGYNDDSPLLNNVDFSLRMGDRIALLGRNGTGKTTLLRSLCGEIPLLDGHLRKSEGCRIAYYDQQQIDTLDLEASALLHLQRLSPDEREQTLRDFLGGFDFRGKRADEPLAPFSGGEKARLALALLVWTRPNVLILDEPTNHLDMDMRRALEFALLEFQGAVLLVSHDRHLLRSTADELLRLHDGQLESFEGDLEAYEKLVLQANSETNDAKTAPKQSRPITVTGTGTGTSSGDKKQLRQAAAAQRARRRPLEKELKSLERQIDDKQLTLTAIEESLGDQKLYEENAKDELRQLLITQGQEREALERLEEAWLEVQESLENFDNHPVS